ncbi:N-acetylmuramic acid 6-phosphate etherase [Piscibacillus halophilus]|uniref:N-acetylmuramic acid 6-phosphate etherase n=2 Tax=Piscibacillus halophilus TaxID=571933 RepID=A0A1H9I1F8_9BACI|nr:N-acetylmuramic acid 6-phosphate etherase [Piscibacillus halophilus]
MMERLTKLMTETYNPKSKELDQLTTDRILQLMNEEDMLIPKAISKVLPEIEETVEVVYQSFINNGRLFYVGAGTSGRIGLLDAVECPPTFSTSSEMIQAVIAGGSDAMMVAVEGAEDNEDLAVRDLKERQLSEDDVVIGIAASGRTPYVKGALKYAQMVGAKAVSLSSNEESEISHYADIAIEVITGPEVLTGSTRLKAATAHKMILNMISTASMVKCGKVYQNLMVDVNATNYKLKERCKKIVREATQVSYDEAEKVLQETDYKVKPAIVMILANVDYEQANLLLEQSKGFVREAIRKSD